MTASGNKDHPVLLFPAIIFLIILRWIDCS